MGNKSEAQVSEIFFRTAKEMVNELTYLLTSTDNTHTHIHTCTHTQTHTHTPSHFWLQKLLVTYYVGRNLSGFTIMSGQSVKCIVNFFTLVSYFDH